MCRNRQTPAKSPADAHVVTDFSSDNAPEAGSKVSVLEESLWSGFFVAATPGARAERWLQLQMRQIDGARAAVLVLGDADGAFAPAAFWPSRESVPPQVLEQAERAIGENRPVADGEDRGPIVVACPVTVDGETRGAISVAATGQRRVLMRQLQWGLGWVEALLRDRSMAHIQGDGQRMEHVLESLAASLSHKDFQRMAEALVTDLALRLDCEMVALGFRKRLSSRVMRVSHAAEFGQRMNLTRDLAGAMDEAIDQGCLIRHPAAEGQVAASRAHRDLAQTHQAANLLTVPFDVGGKLVGALTFERREGHPFDLATIELCDCLAAILGPILHSTWREERWIGTKLVESTGRLARSLLGPGYLGRKVGLAACVGLVALFGTWKQDFVVTSDAVIEGSLQRIVAAPFEGYIAAEALRAGAIVQKGDVLARLDDRDLGLERLRWTTTVSQKETEYSRALTDGDRVEASIVLAQIEQARAQVALVDEQIARTVLTAPLDGIIVSGDLSQKIGASVARGEPLFTIAPLDEFRAILSVDERDTAQIEPGQTGQILVAALPNQPLPYVIRTITPVNQIGDGRNLFRVEAELTQTDAALRPGMQGVGKTMIEERLTIANWTRGARDWLRTTLWRWRIWNG